MITHPPTPTHKQAAPHHPHTQTDIPPTHISTPRQTRIHTYMSTRVHTCTYPYTHRHVHINTNTSMSAHTRARTRLHTFAHMRPRLRVHTQIKLKDIKVSRSDQDFTFRIGIMSF